MTEVPEHLMKRAQAAKDKVAAQREGRPSVLPSAAEEKIIEDGVRAVLAADARRAERDARAEQVRLGVRDVARRARRRAMTRTIGVVLLFCVVAVLVLWAVDSGGTSREECWAQGGSWMSTAHDCLLPPPST